MTTDLSTTNGDLAEAITEAQRQVLTQKTPAEAIHHRPGPGGRKLAYVEHRWVNEQLNLAFDWQWSWEIVEWRLLPNEAEPTEAFVLGRLTVHTPRGDLTKTQFGSSAVKCDKRGKPLSIGDDLKSASSDALKKAASLLGLALDLYGSERNEAPQRPARKAPSKPQPANGKPANGEPKTVQDWIEAYEELAREAEKYGISAPAIPQGADIAAVRVLGHELKQQWLARKRAVENHDPPS